MANIEINITRIAKPSYLTFEKLHNSELKIFRKDCVAVTLKGEAICRKNRVFRHLI